MIRSRLSGHSVNSSQMSLSRSAIIVTAAASASNRAAVVQPSCQRIDSLSAIARPRRSPTGSEPRVQIWAPTKPITASSATSTAITGCRKKPGSLPLPPGPSPRRLAARPLKLTSLVSWIATTRRPTHCCAVRDPSVSTIASTELYGDDKNRCTAISPPRVPPSLRSTSDPVAMIRSNSHSARAATRVSPIAKLTAKSPLGLTSP